jgi:FtsP/CotA-like multicopper oxidase with cupredoxin domain
MKYYMRYTPKILILVLSLLFSYLVPSVSHAELRKFDMTIDEMEINVAPGLKSKVWAFNGQVPGPLIHVKEGDEVQVTVYNNTALNHTVHWHGVYQTNTWRSDGVPGVTQLPIEPGESYVYKFIADKPGSLWYHCHVNVPEHVGLRGMWGALIVDPKESTDLEKEVTIDAVLMFSGWNSDVAMEYGKGGHPREKPNYFSINGKSFPTNQPLRVKKGDVLRLRLYSASTETAFHLHGHDVLVTHKDGLPLKNPYWADVVDVPMGARIDVIARMNNPGRWISHDHIEHHVSNNGKTPGGAVMIVEYEGVEKDDWYVWKDKDASYEPDFYMSDSLQKPYGMHNIKTFKGTKSVKKKNKKKKKKKVKNK